MPSPEPNLGMARISVSNDESAKEPTMNEVDARVNEFQGGDELADPTDLAHAAEVSDRSGRALSTPLRSRVRQEGVVVDDDTVVDRPKFLGDLWGGSHNGIEPTASKSLDPSSDACQQPATSQSQVRFGEDLQGDPRGRRTQHDARERSATSRSVAALRHGRERYRHRVDEPRAAPARSTRRAGTPVAKVRQHHG